MAMCKSPSDGADPGNPLSGMLTSLDRRPAGVLFGFGLALSAISPPRLTRSTRALDASSRGAREPSPIRAHRHHDTEIPLATDRSSFQF